MSDRKLRSDNSNMSTEDTQDVSLESKLDDFKNVIINQLTENFKIIVDNEIKKMINEYQKVLNETTATVAMLQKQVSSLKEENIKMQKEAYKSYKNIQNMCEENQQYSRRLCLRIKNIPRNANETPKDLRESVENLFKEVDIDVPDCCLDRVHRISRSNDTIIVRFATFRHRSLLYSNRKNIGNGVTVHLDLTKSRLDLLIEANTYVKALSNVKYAYSDINCRLKVRMLNDREYFFNSMDDLVGKVGGFISNP